MRTTPFKLAAQVAVGCLLALAPWVPAASAVTSVASSVDGTAVVTGSIEADQITLLVQDPAPPGPPQILQVTDPGGVTIQTPDYCTQVDPNTATCDASSSVSVDAGVGADTMDLSYEAAVEAIATVGLDGGEGSDTIKGSDKVESVLGGAGDDQIDGRGAADIVDCGEGTDTVVPDATDTVSNCELPDVTPPETVITDGPTGSIVSRRPTFTFVSTEPGGTFTCQINKGLQLPCTSPFTTETLRPGANTFSVAATDASLNTDPTPASRTVNVIVSVSRRGGGAGGGGVGAGGTLKPSVRGAASAGAVTVSSRGSVTLKRHVVECPAGGASCVVETVVRRKHVRLGGSDYKLAAGKTRALRFKLTRKGLRRVRRARRVRATVTITVTKGTAVTTKTVRVTLKARKRK